MRQERGVFKEISALPYLFQGAGMAGVNPGGKKSQLVVFCRIRRGCEARERQSKLIKDKNSGVKCLGQI
jgi:hypothetical protein